MVEHLTFGRADDVEIEIDVREPLSERAQREQLRREVAVLRGQITEQTERMQSLRDAGVTGKELRHAREDLQVSRARLEMVQAGLEELRTAADR